jgi:hypothetical protein
MYVGSLGPAARCGKPCVWPQYGDAGGEVRELVRCGDVCRACALTVSVAFLCPIRLQSRPPSVPFLLSRRLSVCLRRSSPSSAYRHAPSRAPPNSPPRRRFASASPPSRHSYRCPTVRASGPASPPPPRYGFRIAIDVKQRAGIQKQAGPLTESPRPESRMATVVKYIEYLI